MKFLLGLLGLMVVGALANYGATRLVLCVKRRASSRSLPLVFGVTVAAVVIVGECALSRIADRGLLALIVAGIFSWFPGALAVAIPVREDAESLEFAGQAVSVVLGAAYPLVSLVTIILMTHASL